MSVDVYTYDAWFFIGHRRYVKDGHWIRDAGFLIGKHNTLTKNDKDNIYTKIGKR